MTFRDLGNPFRARSMLRARRMVGPRAEVPLRTRTLRYTVIGRHGDLLSEHVSRPSAEREFDRLNRRGERPLAIVESHPPKLRAFDDDAVDAFANEEG